MWWTQSETKIFSNMTTSGLLCYSCSNIKTSEDCMNVVECPGREECFTRADGLTNGSVHYTVGCTFDMVPVIGSGKTFCSHVCGENLCNLDKCQLPVSPRSNNTRPPRCLSCNLIADPTQCKSLVQCDQDEVCFVRKLTIYGNTRYRLGCMHMQHCLGSSLDNHVSPAIVGKRSDTTSESCALCCAKDHCNVQACDKQHVSISADHTYNLQLLGDKRICFDFNPTACAAFGNLDTDACKVIADVDNLCPETCGVCGHFGWTQWGEWSACSHSCDTGVSERNRQCIYQLDAARNKTCIGSSNDTKACNSQRCAVHGQWSDWGNWSDCSVTCDKGIQIRNRTCDDPLPQFGGMNCTGDSTEIEDCAEDPCPVDGGWCWTSEYCSHSGRYLFRKSSCNCPAPLYGGKQCN